MFPYRPTSMPAPDHAYLWGWAFNDRTTREDKALVPVRDTLLAPIPSLSGSALPVNCLSPLARLGAGDVLWKVLEYTPYAAFMLGRVSRELNRFIGEGVRFNITAIFNQHSSGNYILCRYVKVLGEDHVIRMREIQGEHLNRNSISDTESRLWMNTQASLAKKIRSLGAVVPSRILSPEGVAGFCNEVQTVQDVNLQRFWWNLRQAIIAANPGSGGVPGAIALVEDVRAWMQNAANGPALRKITSLKLCNQLLTCVPMEIHLCTGLQTLDLSWNGLTSLGAGVFQGLSSLQELNLCKNRLTSLEARAFQGLGTLQTLDLSWNGLTTLEAGVFQGLGVLLRLNLHDNGLTFLEAGVFQGLSSLQELNLFKNKLTSLEAGVFQGLGTLQTLNLYDNGLTFLEAGVFQSLSSLQDLNLWCNRLTSLEAGVFQGLSALQKLNLQNNRLTSLEARVFQGLDTTRCLL